MTDEYRCSMNDTSNLDRIYYILRDKIQPTLKWVVQKSVSSTKYVYGKQSAAKNEKGPEIFA